MDIRKLQRAIVDGLEDVKAHDIVVFDTERLSPLFERVIIATGTSNRQTRALAAGVRDAVKAKGFPPPRTEGEDNGEWIIVDCGAAVAHVMQPAIRDYYRLEEIWGDKPVRMRIGAAPAAAAKAAAKATPKAAPKATPKAASKATPKAASKTEPKATPKAAPAPAKRPAKAPAKRPAAKQAAAAPARGAAKRPAVPGAKQPARPGVKAVTRTTGVIGKPPAARAAPAAPRAARPAAPTTGRAAPGAPKAREPVRRKAR